MPRSGPIYTLPEAAFVPNTVISSTAVNDDFADIAEALTDSLARNGAGGMTAVLPLANAGFSYLADPNTGISRPAADTQVITCGGVDVMSVITSGVSVTGFVNATGIFQGGHPVTMIGEIRIWSGTAAPAGWLLCDGSAKLRATFPDLWTFAAAEIALGNLLFTNGNGTTTFTIPDLRGRVPAHQDTGAGRLTATTMSPNSNTLGAAGGAQTQTLITANLPAYTPAGTNSSTTSSGQFLQGGTPDNFTSTAGTGQFDNLTKANVTSPAATFTGAAQGGTSTPFDKTQPTLIVNYIIYAGA